MYTVLCEGYNCNISDDAFFPYMYTHGTFITAPIELPHWTLLSNAASHWATLHTAVMSYAAPNWSEIRYTITFWNIRCTMILLSYATPYWARLSSVHYWPKLHLALQRYSQWGALRPHWTVNPRPVFLYVAVELSVILSVYCLQKGTGRLRSEKRDWHPREKKYVRIPMPIPYEFIYCYYLRILYFIDKSIISWILSRRILWIF